MGESGDRGEGSRRQSAGREGKGLKPKCDGAGRHKGEILKRLLLIAQNCCSTGEERGARAVNWGLPAESSSTEYRGLGHEPKIAERRRGRMVIFNFLTSPASCLSRIFSAFTHFRSGVRPLIPTIPPLFHSMWAVKSGTDRKNFSHTQKLTNTPDRLSKGKPHQRRRASVGLGTTSTGLFSPTATTVKPPPGSGRGALGLRRASNQASGEDAPGQSHRGKARWSWLY